MTSPLPFTITDIIQKVRRIIARPSANQITDAEIIRYVNTFYVFDMPDHLKMESLRVTYQFLTSPNVPVYDFPTNLYLTEMPPVYMGGYQSYMTQSRENFFRINPQLTFLQEQIYTGDSTSGSGGTYTGQFCTQTPFVQGYKPNPPGAYAPNTTGFVEAKYIHWGVLVSAAGTPDATSGLPTSLALIDDGHGNLIDPNDAAVQNPPGYTIRGSVNYITGALDINTTGFTGIVPSGNPINVQYIPYVAARPQSCVFYQDQILLYPIPDQVYTISFEAYQYPLPFNPDTVPPAWANNSAYAIVNNPQLREWWQLLAYGAADKFFADSGDLENMQKYRPLFEEQMTLVMRRSIVQQTSERAATIYTEQSSTLNQWPMGNPFSNI